VDVDATVLAHTGQPAHIAAVAARHCLLPRIDDAVGFAQVHQVLLLRHETSAVPVDISLAWLPFEETALASCVEVTYESIRLRIPPEDLDLQDRRRAPRDIDDAEQLLLLHGPRWIWRGSYDCRAVRRPARVIRASPNSEPVAASSTLSKEGNASRL
jgi:hypothetical protein